MKIPKVSRVLLRNIGHPDVRFHDLIINFQDGANSLIWLDFGHGKTSLLGLFYSVIRPKKSEFMAQRLHKRSLEDYVQIDDVSHIAIEWLFDEEQPAVSFLTGMVAEWRDGKLDKLFYTARYSADTHDSHNLTLDSIPYKEKDKLLSIPHFTEQLRRFIKNNPSQQIKYVRNNYTQWRALLRDNYIDPELFKYQLIFNEREGNIKEYFRFENSIAFLNKIIELIHDEEYIQKQFIYLKNHVEDVRQIADWEDELNFIRMIIPNLERSADLARHRTSILKSISQNVTDLQYLGSELDKAISILEDKKETLSERVDALREEIANVSKNWKRKKYEHLYYKDSLFKMQIDGIEKEITKINREVTKSEYDNKILEVFPRFFAIEELRSAVNALEAEFSSKKDPLKKSLDEGGSKYYDLLSQLIFKLEKENDSFKAEREKLLKKKEKNSTDLSGLSIKNENLNERLVECGRFIKSVEKERDSLIEEGLISGEVEIDDVLTELGRQRKGMETQNDNLKIRIKELSKKGVSAQEDLKSLRKQETQLIKSQTELNGKLDSCKEVWNNLMEFEDVQETILYDDQPPKDINYQLLSSTNKDKLLDKEDKLKPKLFQTTSRCIELEKILRFYDEWQEFPLNNDIFTIYNLLHEMNYNVHFGWRYLKENYQSKELVYWANRLPFLLNGLILVGSSIGELKKNLDLEEKSRNLHLSEPVIVSSTEIFTEDIKSDIFFENTLVIDEGLEWRYDETEIVKFYDNLNLELESLSKDQMNLGRQQAALQKCLNSWDHFLKQYPEAESLNWKISLKAIQNELDRSLEQITDKEKMIETNQEETDKANSMIELNQKKLLDLKDITWKLKNFQERLTKYHAEKNLKTSITKEIKKNNTKMKSIQEKNEGIEIEIKKTDALINSKTGQIVNKKRDRNDIKFRTEKQFSLAGLTIVGVESNYTYLERQYLGLLEGDEIGRKLRYKQEDLKNQSQKYIESLSLLELDEEDVKKYQKENSTLTVEEIPSKKSRNEVAISDLKYEKAKYENQLNSLGEKKEKNEDELANLEIDLTEYDIEDIHDINQLKELIVDTREEIEEIANQLSQIIEEKAQIAEKITGITKEFEKYSNLRARVEDIVKTNTNSFPIDTEVIYGPSITLDFDQIEEILSGLRDQLSENRNNWGENGKKIDENINNVKYTVNLDKFKSLELEILNILRDFNEQVLISVESRLLNPLSSRVPILERELNASEVYLTNFVNVISPEVSKALLEIRALSNEEVEIEEMPFLKGRKYIIIKMRKVDPDVIKVTTREFLLEKIRTNTFEQTIEDGIQLLKELIINYLGSEGFNAQLLKPPQHNEVKYIKVSDLRQKSGSERTTIGIYLYCMLVQYRHRIRKSHLKKRSSHVLILDNTFGQSSKIDHVRMQVENASKMNIQLIYATASKELESFDPFLNIIGLCNRRMDSRGQLIVENRDEVSIIGGNVFKTPIKKNLEVED